VLTNAAARELFLRNPCVDGEIITYDKRGKEGGLKGLWGKAKELRAHNFDIAYSLHKSARTALLLALSGIKERVGFSSAKGAFLYTKKEKRYLGEHDVFRNLFILGGYQAATTFSKRLEIYPEKISSSRLQELGLKEGGKYVVFFPASVWHTKQWDVSGYAYVAKEIRLQFGDTYQVVVLGAKNEIAHNERVIRSADGKVLEGIIDLTGKTRLSETLAIVKESEAVLCNDSMALHLSSSFAKPVVVIFCATAPYFGFGPFKESLTDSHIQKIIQYEDLHCKPCRRHGSNVCPTGTESCLKSNQDTPVAAHIVSSQFCELLRSEV
jgi:heptosyltransferase-2